MATNGMYLTLNQAAKEAGKSPSTIHKAIKTGRLSYASKDERGYKIDPAELFRVFPKENRENKKTEKKRMPKNGGERAGEYIELRHKIELLEKDLEHEKQHSRMLATERDRWQEESHKWQQQAERLALTYQPAAPQTPVQHDSGESGSGTPNQQDSLSRWAQIIIVAIGIGLAIGISAHIAKGL